MSDGGRGRISIGVEVWKSSQKWSVRRSAVRSIAWLDAACGIGLGKVLILQLLPSDIPQLCAAEPEAARVCLALKPRENTGLIEQSVEREK